MDDRAAVQGAHEPKQDRAIRWARRLGPALGVVLFAVALLALHRELSGHGLYDVTRAISSISRERVAAALLLVALNYAVLTLYDFLAVRYVRRRVGYGRVALTSFVSYTFSYNTGMAVLSSTPVRYRFYGAAGFSAGDVAKVVTFCVLTFWLGFFALGGVVFMLEPAAVPSALHLGLGSTRPLGLLLLSVAAAHILIVLLRRRPLSVRGFELSLPSPGMTLAQVAVSSLDWLIAAGVLYVLLPEQAGVSFAGFLAIFLLAQMAGLASQVPGGLGVFESAVLLLMPAAARAPEVLATLLVYRLVYYILPLLVALTLLGGYEVLARRRLLLRLTAPLRAPMGGLVPQLMALVVFVGGALLLFSGATPGIQARLDWLERSFPLSLLEVSHFLGSLVGILLLFLARGLQRRLDSAYHLTLLLLGAGIVFSLLKGLDWEEALVIGVILLASLPWRKLFYRRGSLIGERFSAAWLGAIAVVVLAAAWLGLFAHSHLEYSGELWWQFTLYGDAPRFLRAGVAVVVAALLFGVARLLAPAPPDPKPADVESLERAAAIVARSTDSTANLALVGDKRLLFNDEGSGFVMFGVEGRSWVAMGDPVGPEEARRDLAWRFRSLVDRHDGRTVFYQVAAENLHLYLDLGLGLQKLGEEAIVPLRGFSLEGRSRKPLRYSHRRVAGEGCSFEVLPPAGVDAALPELRRVSDEWLREKKTREKGFSLGRFDGAYLRRLPVAVVRRGGAVVAFANLWLGADKREISVDLMRHTPAAPGGVMEYLFVELMLWGGERGYEQFNLGMAPLSGLEGGPLKPLWSRVGAFIFHHAEEFYNFQGLRRFKEKFDPEWRPRYLASPGGLAFPRILANIASLVSGGVGGVLAK